MVHVDLVVNKIEAFFVLLFIKEFRISDIQSTDQW